MTNIKISAAAQDNFNKIKIGDRVLSRGEYQKFLRELQIVMDDFSSSLKQVLDDFLASIEEDKADDYYHLKEKYSNLFKEEGKFIEVKFNDFLKFWIDYNINYHNLNHLNYDNDKYKLVVNDFVLYFKYEYQIVYKRKTNQEALKIVWKEFDERRTLPPAAKSMDNKAVDEKKPNKQKQPKAKVLMAFIELINKQIEIIPKPSEYSNNDEKFTIIADRIRVKFNYDFSGKTLEKEQYKQEGFSLEVYNLLIEWKFNTIATKYNAQNNK
jgi:hypothetical protein